MHSLRKAILIVCGLQIGCAANPDPGAAANVVREYQGNPWFTYNREIARSPSMPLGKRYDQFSAEEKEELHKSFKLAGLNDEPPFPQDGFAAIVRAFLAEIEYFRFEDKGEFVGNAVVGSDGMVTAVDIQKSPSRRVTLAFARALMKVKFKPALCNGAPCAMTYPINFLVTRE